MNNHSRKILGFLLLFLSLLMGQDPPGIHWQQIKTDHYQIIFPSELRSEANRVANTIDHVHHALYDSLDNIQHKRIPIVLSNRGAMPNGYVMQAPWMSEWYNVPLLDREMGHTEWYRNLAIHEGRHIAQFNAMNQGVSGILRKLFGQNTQSFYTHFMIPNWYWEGDAVDIETALTHSGRGRSAYFSRIARAHILAGNRFTYRNALYGSYKKEYPNHYELGYYLTSHVKKEYGQNAWPKIIQKALKWPFISNPIYPFSRAMKTTTGSSLPQIYYDTFYDLEMAWKIQQTGLKPKQAELLTPEKITTTHFRYPVMDNKGDVVALKSGLGEVTAIVKIKDGETQVLATIPSLVEYLGYHSNGVKAVWSGYDPDIRWTKRSWSNIRVLDFKSGETKIITEKKRFYQPSISSDGEQVTAVSFSEERHALLVILNAKTGKIIDQVESPNGGLIMKPSWSVDGEKIVFTSQKYNGRALYIYRIKDRQFDVVIPETWQQINHPIFYKDFILYESQINGIDQILARHVKTEELFQVTSRPIGAYNPSVTPEGYLLFNDYSQMGDGIGMLPLQPSSWTKIDSDYRTVRTGHLTEYNTHSIFDKDMPEQNFKVTDYNGVNTLFNFHSRYIFNDDFDPTLGIQSDNILGTLSFTGEMVFNKNEGIRENRLRSTIRKFYPIIDVEFGWMNRNINHGKFVQKFDEGRVKDSLVFHLNEKWSESVIKLSASLPLANQIRGINNRFAYVKLGSIYTLRKKTMYHFDFLHIPPNVKVASSQSMDDRNGGILPIYVEGGYSSLDEAAIRDLGNPGWQIYGYGGGSPFGGLWQGQQISLRLIYGFKGFWKHDFIDTRFQYESNKGDHIFLSKFHFPSGYSWRSFSSGWQGRLRYKLPLVYPDWSAPFGLTYLKRIRGNIFGHVASVDSQHSMISVGAGVTFDLGGFFDLRLPMPITFNYYYQPNTGQGGVQLVFE